MRLHNNGHGMYFKRSDDGTLEDIPWCAAEGGGDTRYIDRSSRRLKPWGSLYSHPFYRFTYEGVVDPHDRMSWLYCTDRVDRLELIAP